jgi:hypothetical protein
MTQSKVSELSDVKGTTSSKKVKPAYKLSYGKRWSKTRPTKTIVFWVVVAFMILTMFVGFRWGGWVTGGTSQRMTNDAITQRLSSICVGQFNQDPQKDQKLTELKDTSYYQRDDYVKDQGWATMPGEAKPNSKVADECTTLIMRSDQ